jgi:hypothetical protein
MLRHCNASVEALLFGSRYSSSCYFRRYVTDADRDMERLVFPDVPLTTFRADLTPKNAHDAARQSVRHRDAILSTLVLTSPIHRQEHFMNALNRWIWTLCKKPEFDTRFFNLVKNAQRLGEVHEDVIVRDDDTMNDMYRQGWGDPNDPPALTSTENELTLYCSFRNALILAQTRKADSSSVYAEVSAFIETNTAHVADANQSVLFQNIRDHVKTLTPEAQPIIHGIVSFLSANIQAIYNQRNALGTITHDQKLSLVCFLRLYDALFTRVGVEELHTLTPLDFLRAADTFACFDILHTTPAFAQMVRTLGLIDIDEELTPPLFRSFIVRLERETARGLQ